MMKSKDWPGKAKPRIVCAANRYSKLNEFEFIVVGPRHSDSTMRVQFSNAAESGYDLENAMCEQGFIDQFGDFHTRQEAWKIAEANGQIYRRCGGDTADGGTLYSENLY